MNKTKYTFEPGAIIKSNSCGDFIFLEELQPKKETFYEVDAESEGESNEEVSK